MRQIESDRVEPFCQIWNLIWPHHHVTVGETEREFTSLPPEQQPHIWILGSDEEPWAYLHLGHDIGSYDPVKWTFSIGVEPRHRLQGHGRKLYDFAMSWLNERHAQSVTGRVQEGDAESLRFCISRGFKEVKRDFESVLDLNAMELSAPRTLKDVEILPASSSDSPAFRQAWHSLFEEVRIDTPRTEPPTPLPFDQFEALVLNDPEFLWEGSQVAWSAGSPIGFTGFFRSDEPTQLYQWLTAVKRSWRGKGVASALKEAGISWAKNAGFKTIRTDNDTRNTHMLAINDRLGFRRLPGMITIKKKLET